MGDIQEITQSLHDRARELRPVADELERIEAALAVLQVTGSPSALNGSRSRLKDRLAQIIAASPGLRSTDIAREAGITPSNAQRPLQQLLDEGRVERDDAKRWALTPGR